MLFRRNDPSLNGSFEPGRVLTRDDETVIRLDRDGEAVLLQALDEADREEGISPNELFERLRRFE